MAVTLPPASRMARYKYIDTNPRFIAVDLARVVAAVVAICGAQGLIAHA